MQRLKKYDKGERLNLKKDKSKKLKRIFKSVRNFSSKWKSKDKKESQ